MRKIMAMVKPFRAQSVLQSLAELGVEACVVREAKGYGRQKGYLSKYAGSEYSPAFLPKVEIAAWVPDRLLKRAVESIVAAARTGRIGDGKILILPALSGEIIEF